MEKVIPPRDLANISKRAHRLWTLFVVSLGIFAAVYSWVSWQNTKTDVLRHATQLADIGEKAIDTYFSQFVALFELSSQDLLDAHGRLDPMLAQSRLSSLLRLHQDLLNASIISLDGVILLSTTVGTKLPAPVVEVSSFIESVDVLSSGRALSVSRPHVGLLVKEWVIPIRYAVRDSGGTLRYVLNITLRLSAPQSIWKDAALPERIAFGLMRDDGYLVSRYPIPAALGLTDVYGTPRTGAMVKYLREQQFPLSGHVEGPSSLDGPNHLVVFRRLSGYPLSFFVTQPLSNIRAVWWSSAQIPFLLILLLLAGGYVVFRWTLRARTEWEAERSNTERRLREISQNLDRHIEERTRELRENERRFGTLLSNLQGMVYRCRNDHAWSMEFVSEGVRALLGFEPEDLTSGRVTFGSLIHPDDQERVWQESQTHLNARQPCSNVYRVRHSDGTWRWVWEQARGLCSGSGEVQLIEGYVSDISDRKNAEEVLAESERFARASLDALFALIAVLDGNGRIIATNSAWREFAERNGQFPDQVSEGADYLAVCRQVMTMGDEAAAVAETLIRDLIDGDRLEGSFEYPCHSPQEERWFFCRGTRFPGDGPVRVLLAHVDISARKRAEIALHKSNLELEARVLARTAEVEASRAEIVATVENLMDAIVTIDERGTVLLANPAVERIFGYTLAELLGNNVSLLMPAPHRTAHDGYLQRYLQTGEPRIIGIGREVQGRHKNGDIIPMHLAVSEYRVGDRRHFAGTLRDLRGQKMLTAELRQFRDTLDQALDSIFMFRPDTLQFTYVNKGATAHIGYSEAELLRMKPFDINPKFSEARFRELVQPLVDGRQHSLCFETVHRHKDGHAIPVEIVLQYVGGEDRTPQFVVIERDITERKRAEQTLIEARDTAQLANRAKDSFLATTSHEIRTPLGGLMGMLELLSLTPLNDEQRETLLSARDSGRSLLRILDDLLDWSKIEVGKLELAPQPTSVARLMAEVVNTYARVASAKSLVLEHEVDAGLSPALIVDPLRLSQVLNNFVSNALKFTHKGGVVVRAEQLGRRDGAERVRFSVTDSGIGIDKDVLPRLFQNYGQGSAETARMYGGTGLGLAICRRLADLLDGRIEVESTPGEGSTFSITLSLPVSTVAVEQEVARVRADSAAAVPLLFHADAQAVSPLILVVDDHPINRRLLALQLGLLGLRTETAQDGVMALSMWRDGRFALVITDCHMPKMDGYALAREIRRIEATEKRAHTPLIGWTANALIDEEANCIAAGMDQLLVKPTELPELRAALSNWLTAAATAPVAPAPRDAGHDGPGGTADAPIDLAALNKIAANAADRAEILGDFMAQARADLAELEQALDDLAASERLAHRMKGACRMVGARELEAACEALQGAARRGNAQDAHAAHAGLNRAMARLEAHLAQAEGVNKEKK